MAGEVGFFNPVDPFALADWNIQNNSPTRSQERAQALKSDGDECASKTYGAKEEQTATYKGCRITGMLALPAVGTVSADGWHLDSWTLTMSNTDWPELSITMHKHGNGKSHTPASCRLYRPTLQLSVGGMGILRTGLGEFSISAEDMAVGITSVTYGLSVTHVDEAGDDGNWLAGENRDGVETFSITITGVGATITAPSGWDEMTHGRTADNTAADTETYEYEHHVSHEGSQQVASLNTPLKAGAKSTGTKNASGTMSA